MTSTYDRAQRSKLKPHSKLRIISSSSYRRPTTNMGISTNSTTAFTRVIHYQVIGVSAQNRLSSRSQQGSGYQLLRSDRLIGFISNYGDGGLYE